MSPTIRSRLQPGFEERVRPTVDGDEHRPEVANVGHHDPQIALVPGAAGDHQRVSVAKPCAERRELDPPCECSTLFTQMLQRVVGERLERVGHAILLVAERGRQLDDREDGAVGEPIAVPEDRRAANRDDLPVAELLEEIRTRGVDQGHTRADELERAGVREATARAVGDVDDDGHAGLRELLRADPVEITMVDDRNVAGTQPLDQILRPTPEPRRPRVLDRAHGSGKGSTEPARTRFTRVTAARVPFQKGVSRPPWGALDRPRRTELSASRLTPTDPCRSRLLARRR